MRIVIANSFSYVTGGADRHCFDLARVLRAHGHDVAFLSTASRTNSERGAFVPLRVTHASRDNLPALDRLRVAAEAIWKRTAYKAMLRLIDDFRPDVVHVHKAYPHLSVAPIAAARMQRIPIVQTIHDYEFVSASWKDATGDRIDRVETRWEYQALNTLLYQIKRKWHVPAVAEWISVSSAVADVYARFAIASTTIHNFILDGTERRPRRQERNGVLYAGRLATEKGVEDVIAMARARPGTDVRLAGQGPLENAVRRAAADLPNVEYLGWLTSEQVRTELKGSVVCVIPSRWQEPGTLACLEAMAVGTPVVAYRVGGLAEYVTSASAGCVVRTDPLELANACAAIAENDSQWEALSANAVSAVRTTHSPDRYLAALLPIYERAAGFEAGCSPRVRA